MTISCSRPKRCSLLHSRASVAAGSPDGIDELARDDGSVRVAIFLRRLPVADAIENALRRDLVLADRSNRNVFLLEVA